MVKIHEHSGSLWLPGCFTEATVLRAGTKSMSCPAFVLFSSEERNETNHRNERNTKKGLSLIQVQNATLVVVKLF